MSDQESSRSLSLSPAASNTSSILTPRRKVQALLAQYSDSDSEDRSPLKANRSSLTKRPVTVNDDDEDSEDTEDVQLSRPSRMAARLAGGAQKQAAVAPQPAPKIHHGEPGTPIAVSALPINANTEMQDKLDTSEDELVSAAAPRRSIAKRKNSPTQDGRSPKRVARPDSPLFFSSPASSIGNQKPAPAHTTTKSPTALGTAATKGRSKFLALVEKERKERMLREAAEIAKDAAGLSEDSPQKPMKTTRRVQRGSSPGDDSNEEDGSDDNSTAKQFSKQARPARKASKKALEDMNRETQRMSRNMQLAHQARTKTKVTKESFLTRFNKSAPMSNAIQPALMVRPSSSSSATASHTESREEHTTPPTSPIEPPYLKDVIELRDTEHDLKMHGALATKDVPAEFLDTVTQESVERGKQMLVNYARYNRTVFSPEPRSKEPLVDPEALPPQPRSINQVYPARASLAKQFKPAPAGPDSDSEIEIVSGKGSSRKYAAFESLPKGKAQETSSHLALRSLAHIATRSDKKQSMNAAEMQALLQRQARVQAQRERQNKIDELRSKGIVIQSTEEREQDQQQVEDLLERARLEAADIQKRERELAKKDGTYVKDELEDADDDDYSGDEEMEDEDEALEGDEESEEEDGVSDKEGSIDDEVDQSEADEEVREDEEVVAGETHMSEIDEVSVKTHLGPGIAGAPRGSRRPLVVSDDDDDEPAVAADEDKRSPKLPFPVETPRSVLKSARKVIPGLQMSDDLPMGLSQAFAATMADSQSHDLDDTQANDSLDLTAGLPSPVFAPLPSLGRMDFMDMISDSQPASQTQPLDVNLSFTQDQAVPGSPARGLGIYGTQYTPSHAAFNPTQDDGYMLSPFKGSRFEETPGRRHSQATVGSVMLPSEVPDSPIVQRQGRLRRGRAIDDEHDASDTPHGTAFQVMLNATKKKKSMEAAFEKSKSDARGHFDEAAEESEDEYAGLGGASDDDGDDKENEDDRRMIDEDVQIGRGEEAKLAGLYADRERERDEKEVSKLLKDITTGALRRKRGVGDELDLSDEEDEITRRREAKRREFARMRRELLKDEAVGKIADDKKKEAFLRSIEDREAADIDDDNDFNQPETQDAEESQEQSQVNKAESNQTSSQNASSIDQNRKRPLDTASDSQLNRLPSAPRRTNASHHRRPGTLAEIRESVSFLIDEPDSQAATIDLGLSDSEDEPEAYVNLDRHLREAEQDENDPDDDAEDLGDFIVDDEAIKDDSQDVFKKPDMPPKDRAPFAERRTPRTDVVDRLSLARQSSSSMGSNASTKMAFFASKSGSDFAGVPSLLRRATTNSSIGSIGGRDNVSATGVTTSKPERGNASEEKEFVRKGSNGRRNAVNYQARTTLKEEKMSERAGIAKKGQKHSAKGGKGFLGGLFRGDSWE